MSSRQIMQPGREVKLNFKKASEMITGPGGGSKNGTRQSKFCRRRHQRAPRPAAAATSRSISFRAMVWRSDKRYCRFFVAAKGFRSAVFGNFSWLFGFAGWMPGTQARWVHAVEACRAASVGH